MIAFLVCTQEILLKTAILYCQRCMFLPLFQTSLRIFLIHQEIVFRHEVLHLPSLNAVFELKK